MSTVSGGQPADDVYRFIDRLSEFPRDDPRRLGHGDTFGTLEISTINFIPDYFIVFRAAPRETSRLGEEQKPGE